MIKATSAISNASSSHPESFRNSAISFTRTSKFAGKVPYTKYCECHGFHSSKRRSAQCQRHINHIPHLSDIVDPENRSAVGKRQGNRCSRAENSFSGFPPQNFADERFPR